MSNVKKIVRVKISCNIESFHYYITAALRILVSINLTYLKHTSREGALAILDLMSISVKICQFYTKGI